MLSSETNAEEYKQLLAELAESPQKPPRSKLEPHLELIRELRRKGRTYRELARIFEEKIGLHVSPSTLHSFVKVRARHRKRTQFELPPSVENSCAIADNMVGLREKPEVERKRPRFVFRENESLKLTRSGGDV